MQLLPQSRGYAPAFRRGERHRRIFLAKMRSLQKSWRALRTRDVPARSPFRYPTDLEARSIQIRVAHGILRQRRFAVISCYNIKLGAVRARSSKNQKRRSSARTPRRRRQTNPSRTATFWSAAVFRRLCMVSDERRAVYRKYEVESAPLF